MPSLIYAQNESKAQPNKEKQEEITNKFIRANKSFSKGVDKVAEDLDKNISPEASGEVEANKTKLYFILGGDFADNGDIEGNFRYGAQLHLPRFERYWRVKFDNQDEKRERGQSALVRSQRAKKSNDEVFLGVSFTKNWDRVKVDYKPQLAISKGVGIDHSIEAETEYEYKGFSFEPKLEFFANHDEATGSSASLRVLYWLYKKKFGIEQGNDARFVFLDSQLVTNHSGGFVVIPNDRIVTGLHYFRSFENK